MLVNMLSNVQLYTWGRPLRYAGQSGGRDRRGPSRHRSRAVGAAHTGEFDDLARINSWGPHKAPKMCPSVFLGTEFETVIQKTL